MDGYDEETYELVVEVVLTGKIEIYANRSFSTKISETWVDLRDTLEEALTVGGEAFRAGDRAFRASDRALGLVNGSLGPVIGPSGPVIGPSGW